MRFKQKPSKFMSVAPTGDFAGSSSLHPHPPAAKASKKRRKSAAAPVPPPVPPPAPPPVIATVPPPVPAAPSDNNRLPSPRSPRTPRSPPRELSPTKGPPIEPELSAQQLAKQAAEEKEKLYYDGLRLLAKTGASATIIQVSPSHPRTLVRKERTHSRPH